MALANKMMVLAIANLVGFAAAVMANHLHPFSHAIRTPNMREYLWFLGGLLVAIVLATPLVRRCRSAHAMAFLGAALPAASTWIIVNLGHSSHEFRLGGLAGLLSHLFSSYFIFGPFMTYLVTHAYLSSIISATIALIAVKYSNRIK